MSTDVLAKAPALGWPWNEGSRRVLFLGRRFAVDGMRVLVCGGRDFTSRAAAYAALDRANAKRRIVLVIHGGARGADTIAGDWARARGIPVRVFLADWETLGRFAGHARNARMLAEGRPQGVIAFPGGVGTRDMITRAQATGVPVWQPLP